MYICIDCAGGRVKRPVGASYKSRLYGSSLYMILPFYFGPQGFLLIRISHSLPFKGDLFFIVMRLEMKLLHFISTLSRAWVVYVGRVWFRTQNGETKNKFVANSPSTI